MPATTPDGKRINLMRAQTELTAIEILIEYAQLSEVALERLKDAVAIVRQTLDEYRGTLA